MSPTGKRFESVEQRVSWKKEQLISDEDAQTVIDRANEMKELRGNHFKELYDTKSAEAEQARDEIDAAVQAWKDKWYKELEGE